ncbi:MAG: hypothetical protein HYU60_04720 [Magnetospirillum sp.]|nr:hypothetical protein [Magnetospirillum sp.]
MTATVIAAAVVREELEKAASLVTTAYRLLATGTMVDLSALEGKVRFICEALAGMERDEGAIFRPGMEALIADLDHLAEAIQERHQPFAVPLDGATPPGA